MLRGRNYPFKFRVALFFISQIKVSDRYDTFFFFFHENRWLSHILLESLRAKLLPFLVFTKTKVKF